MTGGPDRMRILVTGAAGMLGSDLCPVLRQAGNEVFPTDISSEKGTEYLDVRDQTSVNQHVRRMKPDLVMHLAAETDVDKCELEPQHAFVTNTIGTQNVALACQAQACAVVYISTIGVFDGEKTEPYEEWDTPNPINVYGRSKLEGEKIVSRLLSNYFIVRAGWMMGGGPTKDKKFVGKIVNQLAKGAKTLRAVDDKFGSPTYAEDFSNCLVDLIRSRRYGLYHCTSRGVASRYEIAKRIVQELGKSDIEVLPVSSAYFPLPARRARSEVSRNRMLELLAMDKTRTWQEALKAYIQASWIPQG